MKEKIFAKCIKDGECILWNGHVAKNGYGLVWHSGKNRSVHRVSYELHFGPIPSGSDVMHSCDNRRCVNPAHLSLGSRRQNMLDMYQKGRDKHAKGSRHGQSKLTESAVLEIRCRHKPNSRGPNSTASLAKEFGVTPATILNITSGHTWKHLYRLERNTDA